MSQLVCLGRHTVAGVICTSGRQFRDWSADYRLLSKDRFTEQRIFKMLQNEVAKQLAPDQPMVVSMDDSIIRKRGTKIPGVAWRRDPLGPPFHVNFVRAQRILQLSAAIPHAQGPCPARMIPIDFVHAPTPKKPLPKASRQDWERYRLMKRFHTISTLGARRVWRLRDQLDQMGETRKRKLWVVVDGRFTNKHLTKQLPERTVLIGRIRGDAKLYHLPRLEDQPAFAGRKRLYGEPARTPEVLRKDEGVPWETVSVFAAGKAHEFKIKIMRPVLWRAAGAHRPLVVIAIAPLAYRPRKQSRLLYRKPAYLICTDPDLAADKIIQAYIWRWDIEVNLRDEKQLIGVGEAQVRSELSVSKAPALAVAGYAILLLAAHLAYKNDKINGALPPPKWREKRNRNRPSTQELINQVRFELWGQGMGLSNLDNSSAVTQRCIKPEKLIPPVASAALYAVR